MAARLGAQQMRNKASNAQDAQTGADCAAAARLRSAQPRSRVDILAQPKISWPESEEQRCHSFPRVRLMLLEALRPQRFQCVALEMNYGHTSAMENTYHRG